MSPDRKARYVMLGREEAFGTPAKRPLLLTWLLVPPRKPLWEMRTEFRAVALVAAMQRERRQVKESAVPPTRFWLYWCWITALEELDRCWESGETTGRRVAGLMDEAFDKWQDLRRCPTCEGRGNIIVRRAPADLGNPVSAAALRANLVRRTEACGTCDGACVVVWGVNA